MKEKVIIIGAGPGGLSAGMILSHQGYEVVLYEKNSFVGGRNGCLQIGDYRFDIGPTFLMLPEVLEDIFRISGRKLSDYLDLKEIDPLYRLSYDGKYNFYPTRDPVAMKKQIETLFPGDGPNYERYMAKEKLKFDKVFSCLKIPYGNVSHLLRSNLIKAIPNLDLGKTLYDKLSDYFIHHDLRIAMTFQSKYLGMSPWQCPAVFSILSYIEHSRGIHHPIGGLNQISEAMAKIILENGGKIHLSSPVKEIIIENRSAKGVLLQNGEIDTAQNIVINADFATAMTKLVPQKHRRKYTDKDLDSRDYSCSTFMLYMGVNKIYDIPHHNIFFAKDYQKNVHEIAVSKVLPQDPSFYIQNASVIDPTLAPEGKSTLYALVPVPNLSANIDWEKEKDAYKTLLLEKIKEKTELKDLAQHIEVMHIVTPKDWEQTYGVYKGATFNLSHKISQMLHMRPRNKFEEFENCYLVGGGTHPGSGLPTIYESARISANLIIQKNTLRSGFRYKDYFDAASATTQI